MFSQEIKWSTLDSGCSINFQRILKPEIEKMGNVKKYVTMGTQIPKWGDQGPNSRQCSLSEYQVQIKFQMFTITSAVPSDIPVLASSEQQRFAVDNQDVLPQGPVQPAHGPVGPLLASLLLYGTTASTARSAAAAPARNAAACAYSTRLGTSDTAEF